MVSSPNDWPRAEFICAEFTLAKSEAARPSYIRTRPHASSEGCVNRLAKGCGGRRRQIRVSLCRKMPDGDPRRYLNALPQSRCGPAALVAVAAVTAADVDPPRSICGPHPAIAAVVGGVGIGRAEECKAIEA